MIGRSSLRITFFLLRTAAIVVIKRHIRIQSNRLIEIGDGPIQVSIIYLPVASGIEGKRQFWVQRNGLIVIG